MTIISVASGKSGKFEPENQWSVTQVLSGNIWGNGTSNPYLPGSSCLIQITINLVHKMQADTVPIVWGNSSVNP